MTLLPAILNDDGRKHPLLVLQSSLAQSSLPILRSVLSRKTPGRNVLICLLYPPAALVDAQQSDSVEIHDWLDRVPGYHDADASSGLLSIVEKALQDRTQPTTIAIDSLDTLLADLPSLSSTHNLLTALYTLTKIHPCARLILHTQSPSPLIPLIAATAFSSSLAQVIAHPPALIVHLATEFLVPPPPLTPPPKFWSVFLPVSERVHDTEKLVLGANGEGSGHPSEIVVELIVREGSGRKRGVERVLEGWSSALKQGSCELTALESLKEFGKKQKEQTSAPDPTQNLSFNLNLTSSQQESRAQVPLPYVHDGKPVAAPPTQGAIFYDPDSADDLDDDDPDEDLDI